MAEMCIDQDRVVELQYRLTDENGTELDSSEAGHVLTYVHGHRQILPGLEDQLTGKRSGEDTTIVVPPEGGFGPHHNELVVSFPRSQFEFDVTPGSVVQASLPDGRSRFLQVIEVSDETVTLDGNHPLAGKTLIFEVKVESVRPATPEEISTVDQPGAEA